MKPIISVVVPAYNEEKEILRCIDSLKNQSVPNTEYEIIIVDNNSTDRTCEIVKTQSVRLVHCLEKGVAAARQYGVEQSIGEIIAFTDADSFVSDKWLEKILAKMKDRELLLLGGKVLPDSEDKLDVFAYKLADLGLRLQQFLGKVLPWGLNMAVRKNALLQIGGFDRAIPSAEDWDVAMRIRERFGSGAVRYVPSIVAYTSNRKQANRKIFARYFFDGVINYVNFALLGKKKLRKMITVR